MLTSILNRGVVAGLVLAATACSPDPASAPGATGSAPRTSARYDVSAEYVGSQACIECHEQEHEAWVGSHHDLAMQVANADTILGDFGAPDGSRDVVFEHLGATTRFFRRGDAFLIEAEGPDGAPTEYEVQYVFGVDPLQQYLFDLGDGKQQCLTVAWDTVRNEWFSLYPDQRFEAGDPLHWTGRYQNWNGMCADCHSTALAKNYDAENDAFTTTWEEIDVGCEACHGPASEHVAWAEDFDGDYVDPADDVRMANLVRRGERDAQIDTCAPCHSRRSRMTHEVAPGAPFLEHYRPELLVDGSYHADGQILDEVYVYGSFAQSKMYQKGVACTDCHDPHTLDLLAKDNALCGQCHSIYPPVERFPDLQEKEYDTPEHHFHDAGTEAARCVSCHMPAKNYMVVDPRHDHSMRIPRPDLALRHGTPDACTSCHQEEGAAWCAERIDEWYGAERGDHFTSVFARARTGDPGSLAGLARIAADVEQSSIVRATALELARRFGPAGVEIGRPLIADPDPWVRATAVRTFEGAEPLARIAELVGLLEDPARAVRAEAARSLAPARADIIAALAPESFESSLTEWVEAQEASAEMPWPHLNLGAMYQDRSEVKAAVDSYERALALDPYFLPAAFNLATLYNSAGRNLAAERVLRASLELVPDEGQLHYSLGLLLNEMGRVPDAAASLAVAAELLPDNPRVLYNAGLALDQAGRDDEAEPLLLASHRIDGRAPDVVHALALFYEEQGDHELALPYAEKLLELAPESEAAVELATRVRDALRGS